MRSKAIWLTWVTALLLSCSVSNPSCAVDLNNVRPTQDTYIQQNTASSSYGGNGYVWLGDMGNVSCTNCLAAVLLQYDIASIPRNATVGTVTLSFQRSAPVGAGTMNISLRQPIGVWSESTATWNLVSLGGVIGNATMDTNLGFPTLTDGALKTIVAGWVADPSTNRGLAIVPDTSTSSAVSFYSKENAQGNPVRLSIRYSLPPTIEVTPTSTDFGTVAVGLTTDRSFTVRNAGGGTLSGSATANAPFSVVSGGTYNLAAGASQAVGIRFTPAAAQTYNGTATFSGAGGASSSVTGIGTTAPSPVLSISPASRDFGSVAVGSSADLSFTVQNTGGGTLSGSASVSAPFSPVSGSPYSLTAGQSVNVFVRFAPTSAQSSTATVSFSGAGGATASVSGTGTSSPLPADPSWLRVTTASQTQLNLQWDDNSTNENGFKVERKDGCCGPWNEVATLPANSTTYQSTGLTCNSTYAYRVWAFNSAGNSGKTNEANNTASACSQGTVPTPDPSWLRVSVASPTQINLQWDDNSPNEDGFKVERKQGCCGPWVEIATLPANSTTYQSTGLTCSGSYAYRVWAFNTTGDSGKTNETAATPGC
jgi:Fibronectin type III domain